MTTVPLYRRAGTKAGTVHRRAGTTGRRRPGTELYEPGRPTTDEPGPLISHAGPGQVPSWDDRRAGTTDDGRAGPLEFSLTFTSRAGT